MFRHLPSSRPLFDLPWRLRSVNSAIIKHVQEKPLIVAIATNPICPSCGYHLPINPIWFVVGPPLWKIWKSIGMILVEVQNVDNVRTITVWVESQTIGRFPVLTMKSPLSTTFFIGPTYSVFLQCGAPPVMWTLVYKPHAVLYLFAYHKHHKPHKP